MFIELAVLAVVSCNYSNRVVTILVWTAILCYSFFLECSMGIIKMYKLGGLEDFNIVGRIVAWFDWMDREDSTIWSVYILICISSNLAMWMVLVYMVGMWIMLEPGGSIHVSIFTSIVLWLRQFICQLKSFSVEVIRWKCIISVEY